jgi:hypothetical protein
LLWCRDCPQIPRLKCFSFLRIPSDWYYSHVSSILAYNLKLFKNFTLSPWVGELGRLQVWNQFGWPSERLNKNSRRIISRKQSSYNFLNCSFWIKTFHLVLKFILCYTIERILFYMQVLLYLYFQVLAFKNILGKVKWGNSSLWNENNDNLTPWYFIK